MKYSIRMNCVKPSAIRRVQKKIVQKPGVISFAAGLPDPALFPIQDLQTATQKLMQEKGTEALQYGLTKGYGPLIDCLVDRMKTKEGVDTSSENILITTGSQQGLAMSAMLFLDKDDIVITENPSYLGGINACRPYQCRFIGVDTDDEGMVLDDLERVLKENPKAKLIYVIPNFQNPTGKAWTLQRRKDFMRVIAPYDVAVIEDNPYGEIRFMGNPIPSLKAMDSQGKVVYLGSCSKILCPGLRVAWICAEKTVIAKLEQLKEGIDLQSNQFAQMQVAEYFEQYDVEQHIQTIQAEYKKRCDLMLSLMAKLFPPRVTYTKPEGGMFIWVELPPECHAEELLDEAIEAGVAYVPGEYFFANSGKKNTMRLNFTTVSEEQIAKGMVILANILKKHIS